MKIATLAFLPLYLAGCALSPDRQAPVEWPGSDAEAAAMFNRLVSVRHDTDEEHEAVMKALKDEIGGFCDDEPWRQLKWISDGIVLVKTSCAINYGYKMNLFALQRDHTLQWHLVRSYHVGGMQVVP